MSVLLDAFQPRIAAASMSVRDAALWVTNASGAVSSVAGESVAPSSATGLSTYYACIRGIAEDVGKLPWVTYERVEPRGKRRAPKHPLYDVLHTTCNQDMTSSAWREVMTQWALGWGNAYAEILRDGRGRPAGLAPIHPSRVTVKRNEAKKIVYEVNMVGTTYMQATPGGKPNRTFDAADIFHVHGVGDDGLTGYSVCQLAAETIGLGKALEKFSAGFFGNGVTFGNVFKYPQKLSKEKREEFLASLKRAHGEPGAKFKSYILEGGMELVDAKMGIPPRDAMLIEAGNFNVETVCRWFRMPPAKVGHLTGAKYNNYEHQSLDYVVDTIMAWLVRFEQEAQRKLFVEDDKHFAAFVVAGLLRGDHAARANYYREMFHIGSLSPNDIRELEDMNPIEGESGDAYYAQSAITTLDRIVEGTANTPDGSEGGGVSPFGEPPAGGESEPDEDEGADEADTEAARAVAACLPVFTEAAQRVVRKHSMAIFRAIKREKVRADLEAWLDKFCQEQRGYLVEAMTPAAVALCMLWRGGMTPVEALGDVANRYVNRLRLAALAVYDGSTDAADENEQAHETATLANEALAAVCAHKEI